MNQILADDVRFEGVALGKDEVSVTEQPCIVISQPMIRAADKKNPHPSEEEIERFMLALGFNKMEDAQNKWRREADKIVVLDTKVHNFVRTLNGVVPIDVIIGREFVADATPGQ